MNRAIYTSDNDLSRLFKNTISDPASGVRDHAILRLLFGLPVRSIEIIRLMTNDVCNQAGTVNPNEKLTIREEISFSGIERPMPLLDSQLIKALQLLIDWRIENGWGVTPTGYIDLDTPLFLVNKTKGFATNNIIKNGKQKVSAQSINRVIKKRFELNRIEGNIESGLRTWTLNRHHEGRDARAIWMLRGDLRFDTVQNIIRNDNIRLGALVENVY